jgi:signal transduction histidine kinase
MSLKRLEEGVSADNSLATQRQQQLLRQLTSLSQSIATMLHEEQWQLHNHVQTTPLISLLNRLMERSGPLIRQRQLWSKVHNDTNVIIGGDIIKIEFILHELLVAACERSPEQGRIDIWCRPLDRATLELSITDDGTLPQQLLDDLENGRPEDILCPSSLDEPPGLHFAICQAMMQQVGGECSLNRLEDGRIMSRIILTIANKGMASPMVGGPATSPFSRQRGGWVDGWMGVYSLTAFKKGVACPQGLGGWVCGAISPSLPISQSPNPPTKPFGPARTVPYS